MRSIALFLVIFVSASLAMARPVLTPRQMQHLLAIDADGSSRGYDLRTPTGLVDYTQYDFSNHLDSIIAAIRASGRTNIMIYIYGGNSAVDEGAERSCVLSTSVWHTTDFYPICVSWESSMFDAYYDHLFWIRRGARAPILGPLTMPLYLFSDFGSAFVRAPITLINHSYATARGMINPLDIDRNAEELAEDRVRALCGDDLTSPTVNVLRRIVYTCGFPFRIFTVPVIDAGGKNMWRIMCARTQIVFQKSSTIDVPYTEEFDVAYSPPDGALGIMMERLVAEFAGDPRYQFTLVGYSFGAKIANYAVRRFPQLTYSHIVFLGGATSLEETGQCLMPYLSTHPNCTFHNVCLHQRADEREYMWTMILPRGSILEWIDSFLSDPTTLNDLSVGLWKNAIRTLPVIVDEVRPQIVIKAFGINDPVFNTVIIDKPEKHIHFGEVPLGFWKPEFWALPDYTNVILDAGYQQPAPAE